MNPRLPFTHRDHRIFRDLRRSAVALCLFVGGLCLVISVVPTVWISLAGVVGLLVVGGAFLAWADPAARRYMRDLDAVGSESAEGWARAEGSQDIGLMPRRISGIGRSPHRRRPTPRREWEEPEPYSSPSSPSGIGRS